MRVLVISKPYVGATYRKKLVELSRISGLEVGLICPPAWGSQVYEPDDAIDRYFWNKRCPIIANGKNHFHFYLGIEKLIRDFRPDLLDVEEEHYSLVTWQISKIAKKLRVPFVFYTWQNIFKNYPPPFLFMERSVLGQASAGFCGNQEASEILKQKGFKQPRWVIPQMGVDLESFYEPDLNDTSRQQRKLGLGLDPHSFLVIFAGRLVQEKGIAHLIAAVHTLKHLKIALLIIGNGPEESFLKKQAEGTPGIIFKASVSTQELAPYLKASDLLCFPSLTRPNWKEQFGRILVEAMAAGCCVLGSDSGEIPHVIGNQRLIFAEGQVKDLAAKIEMIYQNASLRETWAKEGQKRAAELYSQKRIAEQFAEAFFQLRNNNAE